MSDQILQLNLHQEIFLNSKEYYSLKTNIERFISFFRLLTLLQKQTILPMKIIEILNLKEEILYTSNLYLIHNILQDIYSLDIKVDYYLDLDNHACWLIEQGLKQLKQLNQLSLRIDYRESSQPCICLSLQRGINQLSNLQELHIQISDNILSGNFSSFITFFKNLHKLKNLSLIIGQNNLKVEDMKELFLSLQTCILLEKFQFILHKNKIGDSGFVHLCELLKYLTAIQSLILDVRQNELTNKSGYTLGLALQQLQNLEYISLSFSDSQICSRYNGIGEGFKYLIKLIELKIDLGEVSIGNGEISELFSCIRNILTLRKLSITINENLIGIIGASSFSRFCNVQSELTDLNLVIGQGNNIQDIGASSIARGFKSLQKLKNLRLILYPDNRITGNGWKELFEGILSLQSLESLELFIYDNQVSIDGVKYFGQNLGRLSQLIKFDYVFGDSDSIESNQTQLHLFSQNLCSLSKLMSLSLSISFGSTNQQGIELLSQQFKSMQSLQTLSLLIDRNRINSEGVISLSQGLKYLINLKYFNLDIGSQNNIKGSVIDNIGEAIGKMKCLETLYFSIGEQSWYGREDSTCINSRGIIDLTNLKDLINLKDLSLIIYDFYDVDILGDRLISVSFQELINLEKLSIYIGKNYIYSNIEMNFGESLTQMSNLKQLSIAVSNTNYSSFDCFSQMLRVLQNFPLLIDLSFIIDGKQQQYNSVDSYFVYEELKKLKSLEKIKIFTPYNTNFAILSLIQDLPKLKQHFIDLQYFTSIKFEREFIPTDSNYTHNNVIKIDFKTTENMCQTRNFNDFNGIDIALANFSQLSHLNITINSDNLITSKGVNRIFKGIKQIKNIKQLSLESLSSIGNDGAEMIILELKYLTQLTELSLKIIEAKYLVEQRRKFMESLISLKKLIKIKLNLQNYYTRNINQQQKVELKQMIIRQQKRLVIYNFQ